MEKLFPFPPPAKKKKKKVVAEYLPDAHNYTSLFASHYFIFVSNLLTW